MSNLELVTEFEQQTPAYSGMPELWDSDDPGSKLLEEMLGDRALVQPSIFTPVSDNAISMNWVALGDAVNVGWLTPTLAETPSRRAWAAKRKPSDLHEEVADRIFDDRITLLARKYVSKDTFSEEQKARLAILDERVRQLVPVVSKNETEVLEAALQMLERATDVNFEIRRKLGLDEGK